ncbi:unnamed protein product [Moneuplotes crassus]|uniref:Uncharacterized protein n=1 Tax=Euplotes crassus TaxID=5936 RepID=A0AAD1Y756_EUPCR|nr:unnamed protein product [Moneuplotes crassus]
MKSHIKEQKPLNNPTTCTICKVEVYKYTEHLNSLAHKNLVRKYEKEYSQIDELCAELELENKPKIQSTPKKVKKMKAINLRRAPRKETPRRHNPPRKQSARRMVKKIKEDHRIPQYIHDRIVVMKIETKSQPYSNKLCNRTTGILEQLNSNSFEASKKCYSHNSNESYDLRAKHARPYSYITKSSRTKAWQKKEKAAKSHKAVKIQEDEKMTSRISPAALLMNPSLKYRQKTSQVTPMRREASRRTIKKIKRNKRLRKTYFASKLAKQNCSVDGRDLKRPRLKESKIDEYFPKVVETHNRTCSGLY